MARPAGEREAVPGDWSKLVAGVPMLSQTLLEILVCPVCQHSLTAGPDSALHAWLHCTGCGRYYPVEDGIPVMLEDRATPQPPLA
jgi:uncharacterized protein